MTLTVLAARDFRRLWIGSSISLIGDGMTLVALSWLVLNGPGGVGALSLLAACYTAPVLAGGLAVGPLLDRFDKRHVLAADSLIRGVAVATVPLTAVLGGVSGWLPFVVAALHGLLKMVPMAGVPAAIPDLVEPDALDKANALESLAYAVSGIVGYALAGTLIEAIGAVNVLALDAASYLCFAVAALLVRTPLRPHATPETGRPRLGHLLRDRALVRTTLAFMAFNIAEGALVLVAGPWLAKDQLPGGPATLALLLSALSAGELAGGFLAGSWKPGVSRMRAMKPGVSRIRAMKPSVSRMRAIGLAQLVAAAGFLALLAVPDRWVLAAGFLLIGAAGVVMTIWAQSLRMELIPPALRGRAFSVLRTLMQATPPVGAAAVAPLLAGGNLTLTAVLMAALAGLPALLLLLPRD
ncbi:MFS transporter [Nonomuraea sp. NPDC050680]|uniref:MFS transporter n=1 Tax=Nonomuraea sp. NPDC050680 TaxID=3154630 RepID=UPI003400FF8C